MSDKVYTKKVYTIYDRIAKEAGPLFFANNDETAVRNFKGLMRDSRIQDESDYQLIYIGDFDPSGPSLSGLLVGTVLDLNQEDLINE